MKGLKIAEEFVRLTGLDTSLKIRRSQISKSVYLFNTDVLLYIKTISKEPYKWGVTKNVVTRLNSQELTWYVILLFNTHESAYVLNSDETKYYINNKIWPIGADGDYKPASGNYLAKNKPIYGFANILEKITT